MRILIRADGFMASLDGPISFDEVQRLIGTDVLDSRSLRDTEQHVMLFDDLFISKGLRVNHEATRIYHAAGYSPEQSICGDVVIAPDADFAPVPGELGL
jgi:hypothetical protein